MIMQSRQEFMDGWLHTPKDWAGSSHLPVLKAAVQLANKPPQHLSVVEFGGGCFSTDFFLESGCKLTTIEHDDGWWRTLKSWYDRYPKWHCYHIPPEPQQIADLSSYFMLREDILFIDGVVPSRKHSLDHFHHIADTIIIHDSENFCEHGYDIRHLDRFPTHLQFQPADYPATAIFTDTPGSDLIEAIRSHLGMFANDPLNFSRFTA